jgi:polysaccharide biosynthesis transport protein
MNESPLYTSVRDILYLLFTHQRILLLAFLAVVIPAVIITCSMTPIYESQLKILVETELQSTAPLGGLSPLERPRVTANEMQIISSSDVLERVIEELDLLDPDTGFHAANSRHQTLPSRSLRSVKRAVGHAIGAVRWVLSGGGGGEMSEEHQRQIQTQGLVFSLQKRMSLVPIEDSQTFQVVFEANDPQMCSRVLNEIATQYQAYRLELDRTAFQSAQQTIQVEIEDIQRQIDEVERHQLDVLLAAPDVDPSGLLSNLLSEISELDASVQENQSILDAVQRNLRSGEIPEFVITSRGTETNPALRSLFEQLGQARAELAEMRSGYPEDSRQVQDGIRNVANIQRQVENESQRIPGMETQEVNPLWQSLMTQQQELQIQLQGGTTRRDHLLAEVASVEAEKARWDAAQGEIESIQVLLDSHRTQRDELRRRHLSAGLGEQAGQSLTTIRIYERPDPPLFPAKPQFLVNLILAIIMGGFLGCGLVAMLAHFDHSVRSVEQAERQFETPVIAALPEYEKGSNAPGRVALTHTDLVQMGLIHAYRGVAQRLLTGFDRGTLGPEVLLITSSYGGEGASTVMSHLGAVLAHEQNLRVVLLDCRHRHHVDGGHPLNEVFGDPAEGGLFDSDIEKSPLDDLVRTTKIPRLRYVAAGKVEGDVLPADAAKRVETLASRLVGQADIILVDTPPVVKYADYLALAPLAHGCVLVVEFGKTKREVISRALANLRDTVKPMGIVLNRRRRVIPEWLYRHL